MASRSTPTKKTKKRPKKAASTRVLQAVLYLLRADFVTGEVLVLDGGRTLR